MTELFDIEFLISPFSFESKTTIFSSFMFKTDFSVRLCEIEQSECMILFDLFKVVTSFIIEIESSSIGFV